jgi:TRAP-type C4-dicarboxylate transport system permease small subunit
VKRYIICAFFALVVCGVSFYLAYFIGLIYSAATGPLNPANSSALQATLRQFALPISLGLAIVTFVVALFRSGKQSPPSPRNSRPK